MGRLDINKKPCGCSAINAEPILLEIVQAKQPEAFTLSENN